MQVPSAKTTSFQRFSNLTWYPPPLHSCKEFDEFVRSIKSGSEMGEDAEETQKLKRAAAAVYEYEGDTRWSEYWSNILIPPHMASRSDVVDHFKRKFYQRYIDPGLFVEPISMSNASQPTRQSSSSTQSSSSPAREQPRSHSTGSRTHSSSGSSATSSQNATPMQWNSQTVLFSVNAWVFVLALLAIIPLVPRNLSNRAYFLSFVGTACSSSYSLYLIYKRPRAWNLQAVQMWFSSIIPSKDFVYVIYSLIFATSHNCLRFALIPVLCRGLENVSKFLRRNFHCSTLYRKYLEELCVWVESNSTTLSILSSNAEVGLGILLILSLFSWQRNIVATFVYWQLLKLMYHIPATACYHQSVWAKVGRRVMPSIHHYAPFLNTPISVAQRWWYR